MIEEHDASHALHGYKPLMMQVSAKPHLIGVSGQGSWLTDHTGTAYLDFVQGRGTNALGHCAPEVSRAIAEQAGRLVSPGSNLYNDQALRLARRLTAVTGMDQVFFANSGTEANEAAIKLARKWARLQGRDHVEIMSFGGAFHGRSMGPMSATARPAWSRWFGPLAPGFRRVPFNDLAAAARAFTPEIAAVIVEPVQGEAGVIIAEHDFLRGLRSLCDQHGALLIFDEVQTGIGRLGSLFAFQHFGVMPDVMTIGKGLGNGVPIAAVLARSTACVFEPGDHGGTFNGSPLVCAAALATLGTITSGQFLHDVAGRGERLGHGLRQLAKELRCGRESGIGLMRRLALDQPIAAAVVRHAMDDLRDETGWSRRGLLLNAPQPHILRFLPALNVGDDEIALLIDGLRLCIDHARRDASPRRTATYLDPTGGPR